MVDRTNPNPRAPRDMRLQNKAKVQESMLCSCVTIHNQLTTAIFLWVNPESSSTFGFEDE